MLKTIMIPIKQLNAKRKIYRLRKQAPQSIADEVLATQGFCTKICCWYQNAFPTEITIP
jgi:hypothetical protein